MEHAHKAHGLSLHQSFLHKPFMVPQVLLHSPTESSFPCNPSSYWPYWLHALSYRLWKHRFDSPATDHQSMQYQEGELVTSAPFCGTRARLCPVTEVWCSELHHKTWQLQFQSGWSLSVPPVPAWLSLVLLCDASQPSQARTSSP